MSETLPIMQAFEKLCQEWEIREHQLAAVKRQLSREREWRAAAEKVITVARTYRTGSLHEWAKQMAAAFDELDRVESQRSPLGAPTT